MKKNTKRHLAAFAIIAWVIIFLGMLAAGIVTKH